MVPLYFDELAEVLRACIRLRPDECTPTDIQELVAKHLTHSDPRLARKVSELTPIQRVALSAFVLQAQALVGMSSAPASTETPKAVSVS